MTGARGLALAVLASLALHGMAAVALRALGAGALVDTSRLSLVVGLVDPVIARPVETGPAGRAPADSTAPARRERGALAPDGASRIPPTGGPASAPSIGEATRATVPEPPRLPPVAREPAVDAPRRGPVTEPPAPGAPPAPRAALPPTGVPPVSPRRPLGGDPAAGPTASAGLPAPPSPPAPDTGDSRRVSEPGSVAAGAGAPSAPGGGGDAGESARSAGRGGSTGDGAGSPTVGRSRGSAGEGAGAGAGEGGTLAAIPPEYDAYVRALRRRIQERLTYPAGAVRRRLEGTVEVEVLVDVDGRPEQARVVGGEGAPQLQEAALRAVRDATPLPFPAGVAPRRLRIRLPVVFALR